MCCHCLTSDFIFKKLPKPRTEMHIDVQKNGEKQLHHLWRFVFLPLSEVPSYKQQTIARRMAFFSEFFSASYLTHASILRPQNSPAEHFPEKKKTGNRRVSSIHSKKSCSIFFSFRYSRETSKRNLNKQLEIDRTESVPNRCAPLEHSIEWRLLSSLMPDP